MSTSFFIFVNIVAATGGGSKSGPPAQQPSDQLGAKLIVGAALCITNRLHLMDDNVNNAAYCCQQ
jgi:hypothetical protein